jgi:hypothetical protein
MDGSRKGRRRLRRSLAAAALLSGLGACAELGLERGLSGRDAEWARTAAPGDFAIVSADHRRAVVSALGNQVAVEPANGFCLAQEAIETSERSAFLLLGDCALEAPAATFSGADQQLDLPPGVPGIITVTISGDPGFSRLGTQAGGLADLQAFVETPEGRALLGRGGDGDQVSVADSRRIGNTLYVLVEDSNGGVPVLAARFWRAFVELNERLAVVTISGFRDRPLPEEEMLRHLGDQVRQLQVANSEPVNERAVQVAEAPRRAAASGWPFAAGRTEEEAIGDKAEDRPPAVADLRPTSIIVADEGGGQDFWPVPERRGSWSTLRETTPGQGGPDVEDRAGLDAVSPPPRRPAVPARPAATGDDAAGAAPASPAPRPWPRGRP